MDFNHRFDVEPNVFLDSWENYKANIKFAYDLHDSMNEIKNDFNEEIEDFLMLLNLVADRQKGRKTKKIILHSDQLFEKLVVFSKVNHSLFFNFCHFKTFVRVYLK